MLGVGVIVRDCCICVAMTLREHLFGPIYIIMRVEELFSPFFALRGF